MSLQRVDVSRCHIKQRAAVNEAIVANPDVLKTQISPVVIVGLHRSGTTMLHRLLSCDPRFVAPMAFELLQPCPPGRPENWQDTERYKKAQEYMSHIYPGGLDNVDHMHEIKLDLPDECYFILQACMFDNGWGSTPPLRKLRHCVWNLPGDIEIKSFEYYKKALQCIFYKGLKDGQTPLLKCPFHTLYLDTYKEVFPKAKFVIPFRNVKDIFGSMCSLSLQSGSVTGLETDEASARDYCVDLFRTGSKRLIKAIKTMPKERFHLASYAEMVRDPLAGVKEIYAHFGWDFTPETEDAMKRHIWENRQHKHGKHMYNLENYGITEDDIKEIMPGYLEYFDNQEKLL